MVNKREKRFVVLDNNVCASDGFDIPLTLNSSSFKQERLNRLKAFIEAMAGLERVVIIRIDPDTPTNFYLSSIPEVITHDDLS